MIKPGDLSDRQFGRNEPEPRGAADVHAAVERVKGHVHESADEHLAALRERIAKAKDHVAPDGIDPDVWERAKDAVLKAIEAP